MCIDCFVDPPNEPSAKSCEDDIIDELDFYNILNMMAPDYKGKTQKQSAISIERDKNDTAVIVRSYSRED